VERILYSRHPRSSAHDAYFHFAVKPDISNSKVFFFFFFFFFFIIIITDLTMEPSLQTLTLGASLPAAAVSLLPESGRQRSNLLFGRILLFFPAHAVPLQVLTPL
jgi:hypothetical protein